MSNIEHFNPNAAGEMRAIELLHIVIHQQDLFAVKANSYSLMATDPVPHDWTNTVKIEEIDDRREGHNRTHNLSAHDHSHFNVLLATVPTENYDID